MPPLPGFFYGLFYLRIDAVFLYVAVQGVDQVYAKVVTAPADALQPLIPAAQIFTQQLVQVGDFVAQQGTQVSFVANGIQFPTSQQASQYNALIGPLAAQHQAFNQAWTAAVNATR